MIVLFLMSEISKKGMVVCILLSQGGVLLVAVVVSC